MSFRRQLVLSITILVVIPAVLAALTVDRLVRANANAKVDTRLDASLNVARLIADRRSTATTTEVRRLGTNTALRKAISAGQLTQATALLQAEVDSGRITGAALRLPDGRTTRVGDQNSVGVAAVNSNGAVLLLGGVGSTTYVALASQYARASSALYNASGQLVTASPGFPRGGQVRWNGGRVIASKEWHARELPLASLNGSELTVVFAAKTNAASISAGRRYVLLVLIGFILVGIALATGLLRGLRIRLVGFSHAAKRLGAGDFHAGGTIPTRGNDEFAQLGRAFLGMSRQLDLRMRQLGEERQRVQSSMLRLGKAFAANLDASAMVDLVVESAVDGLTADAGRAQLPTGEGDAHEPRGATGAVLDSWDALGAAEGKVLASGNSAMVDVGGLHAIAEPLRIGRGSSSRLGVISVARQRAFDEGERELLRYLTVQAAVSLENVGRHEVVARESITDELTGLANRRRFDDVLSQAAKTATPLQPVSLVMLDLDHFKQINDTHGHQFGDRVLQAVSDLVLHNARDRDLPARYGGEELAVVLDQAGAEGAHQFAERLRQQIEALTLGDDVTGPVTVTASMGVASLPGSGGDVTGLVRAADEALYRAKRSGRNRVELAPVDHIEDESGAPGPAEVAEPPSGEVR